jgi:putative ATP-dependent endonuclease of OLD family
VRISRVKISNFANFSDIGVETGESIVIVGENKVGKSNFVRALQLILDPGLSERDGSWGLSNSGMVWEKINLARRSRSRLS